jgi:hypothetical protein
VLVRKGIERERKIREVEFMAGMALPSISPSLGF